MAERRALTARDVKGNVEGYSEMSDEAFARRFYSDRAELLSLGVPRRTQREQGTGDELYTLLSEQYFLPELELNEEELAALQTALYLLEGKFAYAEPLRLAPHNLPPRPPGLPGAPHPRARPAGLLGSADRDRDSRRGARSRVLAGDAGAAEQARGGDLQAAHGQV